MRNDYGNRPKCAAGEDSMKAPKKEMGKEIKTMSKGGKMSSKKGTMTFKKAGRGK